MLIMVLTSPEVDLWFAPRASSTFFAAFSALAQRTGRLGDLGVLRPGGRNRKPELADKSGIRGHPPIQFSYIQGKY